MPLLMAWLTGTALLHSLAVTEKRGTFKAWTVLLAMVATLLLSILLPWALDDERRNMTVVRLIMLLWVIVLMLMEPHKRASHRHGFWRGLTHLTRSHFGMVLGYFGVAVTVIGIAFRQNYSLELDVRMQPGHSVTLRDYQFLFRRLEALHGPNYTGAALLIDVSRRGRPEATLQAEKRFYTVSRTVMTLSVISGGLTRDVYVALGKELDGGAWAFRLYYKPFVRWI